MDLAGHIARQDSSGRWVDHVQEMEDKKWMREARIDKHGRVWRRLISGSGWTIAEEEGEGDIIIISMAYNQKQNPLLLVRMPF